MIDTIAVDQVQFSLDGATFYRFEWGEWYQALDSGDLSLILDASHLENAYKEERAKLGII